MLNFVSYFAGNKDVGWRLRLRKSCSRHQLFLLSSYFNRDTWRTISVQVVWLNAGYSLPIRVIVNLSGHDHFTRLVMRAVASLLTWANRRPLIDWWLTDDMGQRNLFSLPLIHILVQVTDDVSHEQHFVYSVSPLLIELAWYFHQLLLFRFSIKTCSWRPRLKSLLNNGVILTNFKLWGKWIITFLSDGRPRSSGVWI